MATASESGALSALFETAASQRSTASTFRLRHFLHVARLKIRLSTPQGALLLNFQERRVVPEPRCLPGRARREGGGRPAGSGPPEPGRPGGVGARRGPRTHRECLPDSLPRAQPSYPQITLLPFHSLAVL